MSSLLFFKGISCCCSEAEAEKWQAALETQIQRVAEENAHQGRVLSVAVCKLKAQVLPRAQGLYSGVMSAQALLDQYDGPADLSMGIFVTVLAGNELRRTRVTAVQSGVAKFSDGDDFCVYLPEGQQWRGGSTIKVALMGSAIPAEGGQFKGISHLSSASLLIYLRRAMLHSG